MGTPHAGRGLVLRAPQARSVPTTGHLFDGVPREYVWSSHRAYLSQERPWWLSTETTLTLLGSRASAPIDAYRRFMAEEPDVEEIRVVGAALQTRGRQPGPFRSERPAPRSREQWSQVRWRSWLPGWLTSSRLTWGS